MPEYSFILLLFLVISFILQKKFKVIIFKNFKQFLFVEGIVFAAAILWDNYAIYRGHWSFGEKYLLGPKLGFMPIEEFAFVIITSYFGLVIYKISEKYLR